MGESIIEATVISWLKNVGDEVTEDETILEIATDKVDSDVPAPVSGRISKLLVQPDDVVAIGAVVALIETDGESPSAVVETPPAEKSSPAVAEKTVPSPAATVVSPPPKVQDPGVPQTKAASIQLTRTRDTNKIPSNVDGRFFSPLVRNIARAEGIGLEELLSLQGSGSDGRVTKFDLLNYIDLKKMEATSSIRRAAVMREPSDHVGSNQEQRVEVATSNPAPTPQQSRPSTATPTNAPSGEVIQLTRMRKVIAKHMRHSIDTAAHVTSFVEADATKIVTWRKRIKENFIKQTGQKISLSPLFAEAVIKAIKEFPEINASLKDDQIHLSRSINLGIATAMDSGDLIVPVIKDAQELSLQGLTRQLNDLAARARVNNLKPDEIQNGTFTISNIGTYGNIMGTPIINQPQLAILALGAIKKKPVIQETAEGDIIAIRHMMFLSLSFDHRVIDGYKGGVFLNRIAYHIENFDTNRSI